MYIYVTIMPFLYKNDIKICIHFIYCLCHIYLLLHLGTGSDHFPLIQVIVVGPTSSAPGDGMNVSVLPCVNPPLNIVEAHCISGRLQNTVRKKTSY